VSRDVADLLASISPSFARTLPENLALEFGVLALNQEGENLTIATSEALSDAAVTRIERATGLKITTERVAADVLASEIARCYHSSFEARQNAQEEREEKSLAEYQARLLERAVLERASDIHIDSLDGQARIRFRIDGRLRVREMLDAAFALRFISRLKLEADIDISERRLSQDGRLSFEFNGRAIDVRVASIPSEAGERLALRIFDRENAELGLRELGFAPSITQSIKSLLQIRGGFFVVCGPTGSGKSSTLYAILRELAADERHVCTVEDPVEKKLVGVTQVPVSLKTGLTFAHALRALLRQDPDVVMIGEIRDPDTAETALGAALSGQLVMTTVHGGDIVRGLDRLCELGLSRRMLARTLSGMMTQRLVRRLCVHCRAEYTLSSEECDRYGFAPRAQIYRAVGCERCASSGYRGRVVLADLVIFHPLQQVQDRLKSLEEHNVGALLADARRSCLEGDTGIDEIAELFMSNGYGS
jgi:type II secretory ATPase GspE/PulE/Tfp pilus assembly ATPase PilB-like protein